MWAPIWMITMKMMIAMMTMFRWRNSHRKSHDDDDPDDRYWKLAEMGFQKTPLPPPLPQYLGRIYIFSRFFADDSSCEKSEFLAFEIIATLRPIPTV